ncbi:hypothetical protein [Shewanella chilikensis]|uniref:hypothetical protein n=1 Tax=Shewanella chilikensis TaxID=558541 RepID=UPI003A986278
MTKTTREKLLEQKKERLEKLKKEVKLEKSKVAKQRRKQRDTALFTIGATFAALLRDPATEGAAMQLWDQYLSHQAPQLMTDYRRRALLGHFGLEPKEPL